MRNILTILLATLFITNYATAQLAESPDKICPLLIGAEIPKVNVTTINGKTVDAQSFVKQQPSIIIFYRGGWCPYCNMHLSELGKAEEEILKTGYRIIAISPDMHNELSKTIDKNDIKYTLLSDGDGSLAKSMGIAFKAPDRYTKRLAQYSGDKNKGYLPVPSVFITNKKGEIVFEYINPDYKTRLSSDMLLAVLNAIKSE